MEKKNEENAFKDLAQRQYKEENLKCASLAGKTALHFAAESGDVHLVESLLKNGGHQKNEKSEIGWTALHYAVVKGEFQMVQFLALMDDISCNERDHEGRTPFLLASRFSTHQIVKFLVEHGADLQAKDINGNDAFFLACYGGHLENAEYLHHVGTFDVEKRNKKETSPLLAATLVDEVQVMEFLLGLGAQIECRGGHFDSTPLITAAFYSKLETVKFLVEKGADLNARDNLDADAFMRACDGDRLETMKYLLQIKKYDLERKNLNGKTAWIKAAKHDSIEVKKYLIEIGANIHMTDKWNQGGMLLAAGYSNPENCKFMLDIGLGFDVITRDGANALHKACKTGNLRTVEFILGLCPQPLDIDARMKNGETALDIAHKKRCPDLVDLLLQHGATRKNEGQKKVVYKHPLFSSNWRQ